MNPAFVSRRTSLLLALGAAVNVVNGCANRGYVDQAFGDRHAWDAKEADAYRQWERERRVSHIDFALRTGDEQWAYWNWRHSNPRLGDSIKPIDRP